MESHRISLLGTGLIGDFYTMTLHGQRSRDRVEVVYSRSEERGTAFKERWGIPESTTDMAAAVEPSGHRCRHRRVCRTSSTRRRSPSPPERARRCCAPSLLAGTPKRRKRMLEAVESAGVFAGYLEDLVLHAQDAQGDRGRRERGGRERDVGPVARDASRPALSVVLGWPADRRRRDHRPRLPLHRDHPQLRRQGEPAARGHVPHRHARPPDQRRGQRDRPDPVRIGRDRSVRGELDVPRRDGPARRGGRHARHDLAEPLPADRVRDVHRGWRRRVRRREGRDPRPAGCSRSATRCPSSAMSTCSATCSGRWRMRRRRAKRSTTAMSSTRSWTRATGRPRANAGSRSRWTGAAAPPRGSRQRRRRSRGRS